MPRHELEIQIAIVEAIKLYFQSPIYGYEIDPSNIRVVAPSAGGQARKIEDFGRKPYDIAFYAAETIVIFLEIKERSNDGRILEYKSEQCNMLKTLASNGVDVRYAYNGWNFSWRAQPLPGEVLKKAHVRASKDMVNPIVADPLRPALTLEEYLCVSMQGGAEKLIDVLGGDLETLDTLNCMPLMILANLDANSSKVLVDRAPSGALKMMKWLFNADTFDRRSILDSLEKKNHATQLTAMASQIFSMKDEWDRSNKKYMKPIFP